MPDQRASTPPYSPARAEAKVNRTGPGARQREPVRVPVLLPVPLNRPYDYLAPPDLALAPGAVVRVPLSGREAIGVVWDPEPGGRSVPPSKLKPALGRFDVPPLGAEQRRFIDWVANYTMASRGAVLRMALSVPAALDPPRPHTGYRLAASEQAATPGEAAALRMTPARKRVLATARDGEPRTLAELARAAEVSTSVVKGLREAGLLEEAEIGVPPPFGRPDPTRPGPELSPEQAAAAAELRVRVAAAAYTSILLDGVTGSGKTEVYFEAIAQALERGRQALILLPEIALTAQWLERFTARFGVAPALWHSDLTQAQRRNTWRAAALGQARVVVGARSALFLPLHELGVIIVDEEHDPGFKQEDGVIYHARDMAVVRAHLLGVPMILVSATPSLETAVNVETGRYAKVHLPERHGAAAMPEVELVDLRRDRPPKLEGQAQGQGQSWLSERLRTAVRETLAEGEQAMLFLNRRGYAPLTLCRACGHRLQCPNCTAWLVEHRLAGKLQCHHCGHLAALPESCPSCEATGSLAACGPGVERLAEEVSLLFPEARSAVMASDTLTGPNAAAEMVQAVQARQIDLLIGTQIVAKGHHFPHLTLVGVVDADLGLYGGDLRAAERTFQLLQQVAGRAGRAARPGRVLVQTAEPEHPVMRALAAGERDNFLQVEAEARARHGLPPFGRLAALILSCPDPAPLDEACKQLAAAAPRDEGIVILGPAPAPLAILRGRHRRRFLLKTRRDIPPQGVIQMWLEAFKPPPKVRLQIDINPYSFL